MTSTELNEMHWTQLRKAVTDAGGEYTDKDSAIEFLLALQSGDTEPVSEDTPVDEAEAEIPAETEAPVADEADEADALEDLEDEPEPEAAEEIDDGTPYFNREEPFASIHGISNARFYQNGHYFAGNGQYIAPEDVE